VTVTKTLLLLVVGAAAIYVVATVVLFAAQRSLIYPAPRAAPPPAGAFDGFEEAELVTSDGLRLRAVHRPARAGRPTIAFFHGNGDSLDGAHHATRALGEAGYGLLLVEYRGYGGNPGAPSEDGLYRDGRAALGWLADRGVPARRTVVIGNSLGSGVATQLAVERPVAGVVVISGFTGLARVAAEHMRLFPVRWLLRDRYANAAKLPRVAAPVLVLHGTADTLIPAQHGRDLAAAAPDGTLELVPGVGHELAYLPPSQEAILRWLEREGIGAR